MDTTPPTLGTQSLVMIISTVETEQMLGKSVRCQGRNPLRPVIKSPSPQESNMKRMFLFALVIAVVSSVHATTNLGPWIPVFKGIDHAVGTNTPGNGGFPELEV